MFVATEEVPRRRSCQIWHECSLGPSQPPQGLARFACRPHDWAPALDAGLTHCAEIVGVGTPADGRTRSSPRPPGGQAPMIVLRTLGTASIEIDASTDHHARPSRRFPTLLLLAVEHGREDPAGADHHAGLSGPIATEAAHSLRETIYQLRQLGATDRRDEALVLIASEDVRVDYDEALAAATVDEATLRAMAGGFLPAFAAPGRGVRRVARRAARRTDCCAHAPVAAGSRRRQAHRRSGSTPSVSPRACLGFDTWNERATFALADVLAIGGSKANALQSDRPLHRRGGPAIRRSRATRGDSATAHQRWTERDARPRRPAEQLRRSRYPERRRRPSWWDAPPSWRRCSRRSTGRVRVIRSALS